MLLKIMLIQQNNTLALERGYKIGILFNATTNQTKLFN